MRPFLSVMMITALAGAVPAGQSDARKRILDEINADSKAALERLQQNDSGAATRARQQRVLENLKKLLEEPDPPAPPRPRPSAPPHLAPRPAPKPAPATALKPSPDAGKPKPAAAPSKSAVWQQIEESWPNLPPRLRQEMDAIPVEQLIRNYEELLRAYYRNLAAQRPGD